MFIRCVTQTLHESVNLKATTTRDQPIDQSTTPPQSTEINKPLATTDPATNKSTESAHRGRQAPEVPRTCIMRLELDEGARWTVILGGLMNLAVAAP